MPCPDQMFHVAIFRDKPYMCSICGRVFSQAGSRNMHMKRHKHNIVDDGNILDYSGNIFYNDDLRNRIFPS